MTSPFSSLLGMQGQKFSIERNDKIVATSKGLSNREKFGRKYIGFMPGTDIVTEDWLINSSSERFYVEDTETSYYHGRPHQLKAYYLTDVEYKTKMQ